MTDPDRTSSPPGPSDDESGVAGSATAGPGAGRPGAPGAGPGPASGNGDAPPAELRAEHVAATMMRQLTDLLGGWERQALALAERGVDPRPLLGELARNLRAVADQLDGGPPGAGDDGRRA